MKLAQMRELLQLYSQILKPAQRDVALRIGILAGRLGGTTSSALKKISQPNFVQQQSATDDQTMEFMMRY